MTIHSEEDAENTANLVEQRFRLIVEVGVDTPADFELPELELPPYFDADKFRIGQRVFNENCFCMMIAKLAGLISLLAIPSILNVLIFTKQSGNTCLAFRRYLATILHTLVWYRHDPVEKSEFFASLKNVRKKHCGVSKRSSAAGLNRITQYDMALTQFGFIGYTILCKDQLGVAGSKEEIDGLIHIWRVVGYMLGMEERFNICSGSVEETKGICGRLLAEIFVPNFVAKRPDYEKMRNILLKGLWPINPQIDPEAFTAMTYHLASSATPNNNHTLEIETSTMSFYSKFLLGFQFWVHKNLLQTSLWWSPIFRSFFNSTLRLSLYLSENFPFLAYWMFGKRRSHVDIYKLHVE